MPIELPKDSLGPKPTKKQMAVLTAMATPGATVHVWRGVSLGSGGAYIDYHIEGEVKHGKINTGDVHKFHDWGWLESTGDQWDVQNYIASDRARKVIELGVTRK